MATRTTRHAVVDERGVIANVILCEGDFDPGPGLTLVALHPDSPASPGDTLRRGKLTRSQPPPPGPTLEERVAALEAKALSR